MAKHEASAEGTPLLAAGPDTADCRSTNVNAVSATWPAVTMCIVLGVASLAAVAGRLPFTPDPQLNITFQCNLTPNSKP